MPQFGVSPLSTTTLGANQFPVGECFVPGTANGDLTSLEGILINTDGSGYKSSALRIGLKDGDDVTLGLTTQTKATDGSATSWSVIQLQKGILDKLLNTIAVTQSGTWTVQPGNTANTTAWKVDGSAVTQPVSGTFWQATQPVSGTFWQATQPISVASLPALPANQSINVAQLAGTATDTNSGNKSAGTLRVVLATDQPALTNKLLVTPDSVALPANQSVNVNQIGGTNIVTGGVAGLMAVGGPVASGVANADNPIKVGGVFNTSQPTVTNGQVVDVQTTARGAQIVATGIDTFNVTVNAALPAGTNVIGHAIIDSGSTTAATQATASNLNAQVVGAVASAGANAGNPLKVGGAFNTTQPTVTNAQIVDAQMTARGAQIVATGADTFTVVANAGTNLNTSALALEAGHLANIDTHTPAQGQATMANSRPVAIASDQSNVPVKGGFTEQASLTAGSLNADLVAATDVSAYKWLALQINANAYVGTLTFQGSNDNSVWTSVSLVEQAIGSSAVTQTTNNTSVLFAGPVAYRWFRVRMTAYTSGTAQGTLELYTTAAAVLSSKVVQSGTWTVQPGNTANTTAWKVDGSAVVQPIAIDSSTKISYSASVSGFAPAASATDIMAIYGSGTKTIKITHIEIVGNTSAGAFQNVLAIKRSTTNTGGTPTTVTAVPHDSNDAGATATVQTYAANPSPLGTTVGNLRTSRMWIGLSSQTNALAWDFTNRAAKPIYLRGTGEGLCINFGGSTVATPNFSIIIEWSEE